MRSKFPLGLQNFHKNTLINFELNRWHSFGLGKKEDIFEAAKSIKKIEDCEMAFLNQAQIAEKEERFGNAAIYYHAAEFFLPRENSNKNKYYNNFLDCFYNKFSPSNLEEIKIPYNNSFLHGYKLTPKGQPKETILFHGGFDSLLEEFYYITDFFYNNGYEVIAFEGPGQGYTLRKYGLTLNHDWEKPLKAILDYYSLNNVTLIGASLGGYWCLRGAAFEKRIKKVIAYGLVYDFMALPNKLLKNITEWFIKKPKLMEKSIKLKMKLDQNHRFVSNHWAFITKCNSYGEIPKYMLQMNQEHMHPQNITADVLLLAGEDDEFFPSRLMKKQKNNLINAKSITTKTFTKKENCSHHCQVGNVQLAVDTMLDWIKKI